ncbi:uncharacterized protein LOC125238938 [Leguminivora glycinivorella]|uniref:uncharacterized protein LOC125238938 n=1 Tax=Leguminivora glycinivorella TaxID=1035111 RepID=UPI00200FF1AB|nr:uncharacterized protein LOC125238938 [Leguminivora glycinivorella]
MGLRDAIVIAVLLSQSLCQARIGLGMSLLQGLLSSNPQLANMLSNKLIQKQSLIVNTPKLPVTASQYMTSVPVTASQYAAPVLTSQYGPVYQSQKSQVSQTTKVDYPTQYVYQNVQKEPQKEMKYQVQTQQTYPVSYSTVQQTTQSYPEKPNPFVAPASMVNPFLPAASPMSALCPPTSSILPPADPRLARSQFLRKIPIPPPCL